MQADSVLATLALVTAVAVDGMVGQRLDLVCAMTPGAGKRAAVYASLVFLGGSVVAHAAVDGLDDLVVLYLPLQVADPIGGEGTGGDVDMLPGLRSIVISRTMRQEDYPGITVVSDAERFVEELKAEPGKDIWLVGGGQINTMLLNAGLIDRLVEPQAISRFPGEGNG